MISLPTRTGLIALFSAIALAFAPTTVQAAGRAPIAPSPEDAHREVAALIHDLNSSHFEVRRRAAQRLEELVAKPQWGELLSAEFQHALVRPDVSFEVRWHLERWRGKVPAPKIAPLETASPEELDRIVAQLDSNSFAERRGSAERLRWLASSPKLAAPVMLRLKQKLANPGLSLETRQELEAAWDEVHGAWLQSDPSSWQLPAVSDTQLNRWIDSLVRPPPPDVKERPWPGHRLAQQELMDLLARDAEVPRVKAALEAQRAGSLDVAAIGRLDELVQLTRPAMVAEYWTGRHNLGQQHLLVDVPTQAPGAPRPSHFDRIDDHTAHCVSGSSLSPGDYPASVAFPHPAQSDAVFHLVNLPTPRRRMAYTHFAKTSEAQRLAALSRRTLDRFLADKRPLDARQVRMLAQLDPAEVARFAGQYFLLVEDAQLPPTGEMLPAPAYPPGVIPLGVLPPVDGAAALPGSTASRHGRICALLAAEGTQAAFPGLLQAIEKRRFLPPGRESPHRLPWLAALAIARRDPWPQAEPWLAGLLERTDLLVEGQPRGPQLGATAAGILLGRHGQLPGQHGLEVVAEPVLTAFGLDGYRFASAEAPQRISAWWHKKDKAPLPQPGEER